MLEKFLEKNNSEMELLLIEYFDNVDKLELLSTLFKNINYLYNKYESEFQNLALEEILKKLEQAQQEHNRKKTNYYMLKILLLNKYFDYYIQLLNHIKDDNDIQLRIDETLKPDYELLHKYVLFSYNSEENIDVLYEQTLLKKIEQEANRIIEYIRKINIITKVDGEEFFEYNQELFDLAANIRNNATTEDALNKIFNYLYKGIYESSLNGKNSKIYDMLTKEEAQGLDLIKDYRNFFDHEISKNEKRVKRVVDNNITVIGKKIPNRESDYLKLQLNAYEKISNTLENILDKINKQL